MHCEDNHCIRVALFEVLLKSDKESGFLCILFSVFRYGSLLGAVS